MQCETTRILKIASLTERDSESQHTRRVTVQLRFFSSDEYSQPSKLSLRIRGINNSFNMLSFSVCKSREQRARA